jgi:hypothetical protein
MKKAFYESELEKFKLADGTTASDKFDEKFVEFMEETEDLETILHYDGEHPAALDKHPSRFSCSDSKYWEMSKDCDSVTGVEFVRNEDIKLWSENFVYAAETLPTIALFMMGPWQKVPPFYNSIKV